MKNIEEKLLLCEGMEEGMDDPITTAFLVKLVCGN